MAPVAAEIIPGRPPGERDHHADREGGVETDGRIDPGDDVEKAMASGISASATTIPASVSPLMFPNQLCRSVANVIEFIPTSALQTSRRNGRCP